MEQAAHLVDLGISRRFVARLIGVSDRLVGNWVLKAREPERWETYRQNHLAGNKAWNNANRDCGRECHRRWKRRNRTYLNAMRRLRKRKVLQAQPKWLTTEQRAAVLALYEESRELTQTTGVEHHVDHIVPLKASWERCGRHNAACGLHVPWNLRVVTAAENCAKSNLMPQQEECIAAEGVVGRLS